MQIINEISLLRDQLRTLRHSGKCIGFVPTMGNLHAGHLSLIHEARKHADIVVASIFVNPLQFGINEDLDTYPRTLENDQQLLADNCCDLLFSPTVREMYPNGKNIETIVDIPQLSKLHCGISRPVFFCGIATVVTKLFCIVQPDIAVFGKKDLQQLMVIRQMTEELSLPVTIIAAATARNEQGLALSSRNGYLNKQHLEVAPFLHATLKVTQSQIENGIRDYQKLQKEANQQLESKGFRPDYFHICRQQDLLAATMDDKDIAILVAAHLGPTRLIDNLTFSIK